MKKSMRIIAIMMIMVILLGALPMNALAGSATSNGLVVAFPDSYASCKPFNKIFITGSSGQTVNYFFGYYDQSTGFIVSLGSGSMVGDGELIFPYPATIGGTMTFGVTVSVNGGKKIGGQWTITCEPPTGGEGCTPGYWRNHLEDWPPTGYSPEQIFDSVFGTSYFSPTYTLNNAIRQGGGGVNRLARHGTAALLSAAHPDVNYPYTVAQVIAWVQAGVVDPLAQANELGCRIP